MKYYVGRRKSQIVLLSQVYTMMLHFLLSTFSHKVCCARDPVQQQRPRQGADLHLAGHVRAAVSTGEHEEAAASAELQGMEGSLRDVRGQVEQRRAEAASQNSQGAVVKALLAAKASGQIPGIHGRLGTHFLTSSASNQEASWASIIVSCNRLAREALPPYHTLK